jgi:hypothetical protein
LVHQLGRNWWLVLRWPSRYGGHGRRSLDPRTRPAENDGKAAERRFSVAEPDAFVIGLAALLILLSLIAERLLGQAREEAR